MSIRRHLRRYGEWFNRTPARPTIHKAPSKLMCDTLEDRNTPTILFTPAFGAENVTHNLPNPTLGSAPTVLIFWGGNEWGNGQGGLNADATAMVAAANTALASTPYLSGLSQYPGVGVTGGVVQQVLDTSEPTNGFTMDQLKSVIDNAVNHLGVPEPDDVPAPPVYAVVTPPNILSNQAGAVGFHTNYARTTFTVVWPVIIPETDNFPVAWIGTGSSANGSVGQKNVDAFTDTLSHEVVETMTDPDPKNPGYLSSHGAAWQGGGSFEIEDAEAELYNYRLKGSLVQSYWSQADQDFIVPDGNTQKFLVTDSGTFVGGSISSLTSTLVVNGDQLAGKNDSITLDVSTAGGVMVTLNGETATFEPGTISNVVVNTWSGTNTVTVKKTPAGVPVSINDGGVDAVTISNNGNTQGVKSAVTVNSPVARSSLTMNDSVDTLKNAVTITASSVTGLTSLPVSFNGSQLSSLTVNGGTGGGTYSVLSTPGGPAIDSPRTPVTLSVGGSLTPLGGAGAGTNQVTVGTLSGSLDLIQGPLTVIGTAGSVDALTVADFSGSTGRLYHLKQGNLTRTGASPITFSGLTTMSVLAAAGNDAFTVDTTGGYPTMTLSGGAGTNTVAAVVGSGDWRIQTTDGGTLGAKVGFTSAQRLIGGPLADTFRFLPGGSISGTIDGGTGVNILDYSGNNGVTASVNLATSTATGIGGTFTNIGGMVGSVSSSDQLTGPNLANVWQVTGPGTGVAGAFTFSGVEKLVGGTAADTFQMKATAMLTSLDGGSPTGDWLDYSGFGPTGVTVDLAAGAATGVGFGAANRVTRIQNVIGGAGDDKLTGNAIGNVLVGGGGNDTLIGGSGRSILIGGTGADKLIGGAADDLMIGGSTFYDTNPAALTAMLTEWQSGASYSIRTQHLANGGGLNGNTIFQQGMTVFNDAAADTLTGLGWQDWFFQNPGDIITDLVLLGPMIEKVS